MNESIMNIATINPKPTDTIVLRFNIKEISVDELNLFCNQVKNSFPENTVLALPDSLRLEVASQELWEDYIRMIDEVVKSL